jgi:MFS family permease
MSFKTSQLRWLLVALGSSVLAVTAVPIVLSFAAIRVGANSGTVGLLLASSDGPFVVSLLVGGVLADRFGRRHVALLADAIGFLGVGAMIVLLGFEPRHLLWLALAAAVWGCGSGLYSPTITGLLSDVVPAELLQRANGLRGTVESLAVAIGPSVVGVVVGVFDPVAGAVVCGVSTILGVYALSRLNEIGPASRERSSTLIREMRDGWNELVARDWCWKIILAYSFLHLVTFGPLFVLGPIVARAHLGGSTGWGLIIGAEGLGAAGGALIAMKVNWRYPLRASVGASLVASLTFFALGLGASLVVVLVASVVTGVAFGMMGVIWETYLQLAFPSEVLSRISAYDLLGSVGLFPVGQILAGVVAGVVGAASVLVFSGCSMLVVSSLLLASRSIWNARSLSAPKSVRPARA